MSKDRIIELATKDRGGYAGCFIDHEAKELGYRPFQDLDGSEARRFLESHGFTVIRNYDTGNNGVAITEEGIMLSTNGYLHQSKNFSKVV